MKINSDKAKELVESVEASEYMFGSFYVSPFGGMSEEDDDVFEYDEDIAALFAAAPAMLEVCEAVRDWAKTPENHGGNPYCKRFVQLARKVLEG